MHVIHVSKTTILHAFYGHISATISVAYTVDNHVKCGIRPQENMLSALLHVGDVKCNRALDS